MFIAFIFLIHAVIRFGGLWNSHLIPLSLVIIWPLPWLLSSKEARTALGLKAANSKKWYAIGLLIAIIALVLFVALAWIIFGTGDSNWFVSHAAAMNEALAQVPSDASIIAKFAMVTIPTMIFSPLAEEFLFRGYIQKSVSIKWGASTGMIVQAVAFAAVHLSHYGLKPLQPGLIALWLPSMFVAAYAFGWIVKKSESLWPAVLSHSIFNLGMNGVVFLLLPEVVGV